MRLNQGRRLEFTKEYEDYLRKRYAEEEMDGDNYDLDSDDEDLL